MKYLEIFEELKNANSSDGSRYRTKLINYDTSSPCKYKIRLAIDKQDESRQCVILQLKNGGQDSNALINNINTLDSIKIEMFPVFPADPLLDLNYSIKLDKNADDKIFYSFIDDIISTAKNSTKELVILDILKRVKSWMNFFKSKKSGILGETSQIGLFAELSILNYLLKNNSDKLLETILSWVGPKGQNQDFIFINNTALEIKCTTNNNPFEILINNEYQLDNTVLEKLFLSIYQVKRHKNNEKTSFPTLPSLVSDIKECLIHHSDAKFEFDGLLLEVGYLADAEAEYLNTGFQIISGPTTYEVDSNFPKLTRSGLSNAISKVEYKVNIHNQIALNEDINTLITI
jgi:hypothetical protein